MRVECVGCRNPPGAARDFCVDNGYASSLGTWPPGASTPFRCNVCCAPDATKYREAAIDEYKNRRDPTAIYEDISAVGPWVADSRRATPAELRHALLRVKKHLAPANSSGLQDVLGWYVGWYVVGWCLR